MSAWQTKSSKVVYENPWIIVHEDQIVMPDGKDGMYGYIESKSDSVFVVPVDNDGNTYIVRQERYTTRRESWEGIAGRTDGEPYDVAAKRELLEESGVEAKTIQILSEIEIANGLTNFKGSVCLATDLEEVSSDLDASEGISSVRKLPLKEVKDMIMSGEIVDAQTITAFMLAITYLERQKS